MVNLLKKYLHKNGYSNQKEAFDDLFLSHPNYPSIFAITDSLNVLSIENIAIKVPKEQFIDLPESFLALYKGDLVLTTKTNNSVIIETDSTKKQKLTFNEFLSGWNEVIIAVEPNVNPVFKKEKRNTIGMLYFIPILGLITASLLFKEYNLNAIITLSTSIIGLILSVFIVQEKFGIKNEIASKFCNINPNTSCDSVIKSKKSDINKWIGFSDLPLLFFSISIVSILIQPEFAYMVVGLLCLLSIPALIYSVWLQKFEIKKWCVLCLAVSVVIILQSIAFTIGNDTWFNHSISTYYSFAFTSILLSSIWFSVKPIMENKIRFEKEVNELLKFKRNFDLYEFLSKDIEEFEDFEKLVGIEFGTKNAATQITLILSPSCGHCHTAFKDAYELFQNYTEKIHLNILFNINPDNEDNIYKIVVETLLAINIQNPEKAKEAIIDWHINKLELEIWKTKWTVESPHLIINKQLQNQYYWCLKNEYNFTPVKIVNDKLFPEEYKINELKYFINNFSEEKELQNKLEIA
jgi:uncharacterized membrane protein